MQRKFWIISFARLIWVAGWLLVPGRLWLNVECWMWLNVTRWLWLVSYLGFQGALHSQILEVALLTAGGRMAIGLANTSARWSGDWVVLIVTINKSQVTWVKFSGQSLFERISSFFLKFDYQLKDELLSCESFQKIFTFKIKTKKFFLKPQKLNEKNFLTQEFFRRRQSGVCWRMSLDRWTITWRLSVDGLENKLIDFPDRFFFSGMFLVRPTKENRRTFEFESPTKNFFRRSRTLLERHSTFVNRAFDD